ncbi:MAG: protein kinase [Anaerolineaceae bacterium]|nr:protein kinase [Anaerolineaceae bacterium]
MLLPIGEKLILKNGKELILDKEVGSGLTGVVYKGLLQNGTGEKDTVAVKAMKAEYESNLSVEASTLSEFNQLEGKRIKPGEADILISPKFYGVGEYGETKYLVMEFIQGEFVSDLLLKAEQGCFSEKMGLTIAWQLFYFLDILHTSMKKTYADFKSENIWWLPNEAQLSVNLNEEINENGQIKITDLGTLADLQENAVISGNPNIDLMKSGILMLRIFTGYDLKYSIYGLEERVVPVLEKLPISWGVKQIFRKLLHRNETLRFQSAAEVWNEFYNLQDFWNTSSDDLFEKADRNLQKASVLLPEDRDKTLKFARAARVMLGVIKARGMIGPLEKYLALEQQAEKLLAQGDHLSIGKGLLSGSSFLKAREQFELGMQASDDTAGLRRWSYLAMIGENISSGLFREKESEFSRVIELMQSEDYESALRRLENFSPDFVEQQGLKALKADCGLFISLKAAESARDSGDFSLASDEYDKGLNFLKDLPYHEVIIEEEIGDIHTKSENLRKIKTIKENLDAQLQEAATRLSVKNYEAALKAFRQASRIFPEDPSFEAALINGAEKALDQRNYKIALEIGRIGGKPFKRKAANWQQFVTADLALQQKKFEPFVSGLKNLVSGIGNGSVQVRHVLRLMQDGRVVFVNTQETLEFDRLMHSLPEEDSHVRQEIRRIEDEGDLYVREGIDKFLSFVENQIIKDAVERHEDRQISASRYFEKIFEKGKHQKDLKAILEDLKVEKHRAKVLRDEDLNLRIKEYIKNIKNRIDELEGSFEPIFESEKNSIKQALFESEKQARELLEMIQKARSEKLLSSDEINSLIGTLRQQVVDLYRNAKSYAPKFGKEDVDVTRILNNAAGWMMLFGTESWEILSVEAQKEIDIIDQNLENAKVYLNKGKIEEAQGLFNILGGSHSMNSRIRDGQQRLEGILKFIDWWEKYKDKKTDFSNHDAWVKLHRNKAEWIRYFLGKDIPKVYWIESRMGSVLDHDIKQLKGSVEKIIQEKPSTQEKKLEDLLEQIRLWVYLEKIKEKYKCLIEK